MAAERTIAIWPGGAPEQPDPTVHFWYKSPDGGHPSVCDKARWPIGVAPNDKASEPYVPCVECRDLYVEDIVDGGLLSVVDEFDSL